MVCSIVASPLEKNNQRERITGWRVDKAAVLPEEVKEGLAENLRKDPR